MCPANKTDALVLKTSPYRETSLLVWLLTPQDGVVRAMAKGARRGGKQTPAVYETFAWIRTALSLKEPDALGNMMAPELVKQWPFLRTDLNRLAYAGVGMETIWGVVGQSPPDPWFFCEACTFLEAMSEAVGPGSLTALLLLRLLAKSGFPIGLAEDWTAETLPDELTYHFESGLIERPCAEESAHDMRLKAALVRPLLGWRETPPLLDGRFVMGAKAGPGVLRWLLRVWEDHLGRRLRSVDFLERMILDKVT